MGTCGIAAGARGIMSTLMKVIEDKEMSDILDHQLGLRGTVQQGTHDHR